MVLQLTVWKFLYRLGTKFKFICAMLTWDQAPTIVQPPWYILCGLLRCQVMILAPFWGGGITWRYTRSPGTELNFPNLNLFVCYLFLFFHFFKKFYVHLLTSSEILNSQMVVCFDIVRKLAPLNQEPMWKCV